MKLTLPEGATTQAPFEIKGGDESVTIYDNNGRRVCRLNSGQSVGWSPSGSAPSCNDCLPESYDDQNGK